MMVLLFGLTGKIETDPRMPRHLGKIIQLAGLTAISWLIGGRVWAGMSMQSLAVLSLIVIWLYRGQKGTGGRLAQYGAYAFYPAHMLLLAVLRQVL